MMQQETAKNYNIAAHEKLTLQLSNPVPFQVAARTVKLLGVTLQRFTIEKLPLKKAVHSTVGVDVNAVTNPIVLVPEPLDELVP